MKRLLCLLVLASCAREGVDADDGSARAPGRGFSQDAGEVADAPTASDATSAEALSTSGLEIGPEAGREAGPEAGPETGPEAGPEAGREAGPEAGPEAGREAGSEAGHEAGREAGPEAGSEAGREAGPEAGREADREAGPEAAPDTRAACELRCSGGCYVGCSPNGECQTCATCSCDVVTGQCHC